MKVVSPLQIFENCQVLRLNLFTVNATSTNPGEVVVSYSTSDADVPSTRPESAQPTLDADLIRWIPVNSSATGRIDAHFVTCCQVRGIVHHSVVDVRVLKNVPPVNTV